MKQKLFISFICMLSSVIRIPRACVHFSGVGIFINCNLFWYFQRFFWLKRKSAFLPLCQQRIEFQFQNMLSGNGQEREEVDRAKSGMTKANFQPHPPTHTLRNTHSPSTILKTNQFAFRTHSIQNIQNIPSLPLHYPIAQMKFNGWFSFCFEFHQIVSGN